MTDLEKMKAMLDSCSTDYSITVRQAYTIIRTKSRNNKAMLIVFLTPDESFAYFDSF